MALERCLALCVIFPAMISALRRDVYMGIHEVDWDYAPSQKNLITGTTLHEDPEAPVFITQDANTIGQVYRKAIYVRYEDGTYSKTLPKPSWLGFVGPIIVSEVGDEIRVHLKNFASRPYTMHPHGVFYLKDSEGSLYPDATLDNQKKDDAVFPGQNHTYTWLSKPDHGPTPADPDCITWIYHSHVDAVRDVAAGLIGPLIVCRKGALVNLGKLTAPHFFIMFSVLDENLSWYLEENVKRFCSNPSSVDVDDEDFQESNKMHSINGYVYGNLKGLEMCAGADVTWHLVGMGNEVDIHSAFFHGATLVSKYHRVDSINLFPATFVTAHQRPVKPGTWLLSCNVNDHILAGMQALYHVNNCGWKVSAEPVGDGKQREYFIAAQEVIWNYGPGGINNFNGQPLDKPGSDSAPFFDHESNHLGGSYWKAVFRGYTDANFFTQQKRSPKEAHMGLLGPAIRAEVGDSLSVTFFNNATYTYSIQVHGLSYNKENEGVPYQDNATDRQGASVKPGQTFTYHWSVPESAGPTKKDTPCITWLYFSGHDSVKDTSSGLVGPLIVCRRGTLDGDIRLDVDREFFVLLSKIDENLSWYLDRNVATFASVPQAVDRDDEDFIASNIKSSMNGYTFGTLSGLEMCKGDRVSWHLLGLGSEADIHSLFIFGNPITRSGRRHDTTSIFPHTSLTLLMEAKAVGDFGIVCRTMTHFTEGMKHRYHVALCGGRLDPPLPHNIPTRRVYLAAVEINWDYAPSRKWELSRHNMTMEESYGHAFLARGDTTIGSVYKKAVYREYTDETFTKRVQRGPKEEHLAILGPVLEAEVGERLEVVFKNMASRPYNVHAHGVYEQEDSCYIPPVNPGDTTTYRWFIAEWWGPTENDPDCLTWAYYSTVNPNKDLHSGLIGPVVTCKKGKLHRESEEDEDEDDDDGDGSHQRRGRPGWAQKRRRFRGKGWALGRSIHHRRGLALGHRNPIDRDNIHIRRRWWDLKTLWRSRRDARGVVAGADRAFALLFMVFDENHSWYLRENINSFCGTPSAVDMEDEDFMESNKMHGINGLMYGNLHGLVMHAGENVDWYLLGMGDEIDIHTAHFHGQGFTYQVFGHAHRADVFDLFPLTFETVRMVPENVGSWLLHCHVADHIHGGMETVYTVLEGRHAE